MGLCNSRMIGPLAALFMLLGLAPASAMVTFCNGYTRTIFVAIAYEQRGGTFLSRGWLELDPEECRPFDTALKVNAIWYRAESVSFKDAKGKKVFISWGKDRKFAMWQKDNFNYWNAGEKVLNSSLELFSQGPTTPDAEGLRVIITFREDSVVTSLDPDDKGATSTKSRSGGEH